MFLISWLPILKSPVAWVIYILSIWIALKVSSGSVADYREAAEIAAFTSTLNYYVLFFSFQDPAFFLKGRFGKFWRFFVGGPAVFPIALSCMMGKMFYVVVVSCIVGLFFIWLLVFGIQHVFASGKEESAT